MNLSDSEIERLENGYPPSSDHLITTSHAYNNEFYLWESRSDASDSENSIVANAQSSRASSPRPDPFRSPFSDAENSVGPFDQSSQASSPFGSPFSDTSLIAYIDALLSDDEASPEPLFNPLRRQGSSLSAGSSGYDADSETSSIYSFTSSSDSRESTPGAPINDVTNIRPRSPLTSVAPTKVHITRNYVKNARMLRFNPQGKVHNTRSRTRVEQIKLEELHSGART